MFWFYRPVSASRALLNRAVSVVPPERFRRVQLRRVRRVQRARTADPVLPPALPAQRVRFPVPVQVRARHAVSVQSHRPVFLRARPVQPVHMQPPLSVCRVRLVRSPPDLSIPAPDAVQPLLPVLVQ